MIERKTAAKMPSEEIANVVRKLNEALSEGDIETLMSFYAEDATLLSPTASFKTRMR
jgi:ketosteroid isomerase-like protein